MVEAGPVFVLIEASIIELCLTRFPGGYFTLLRKPKRNVKRKINMLHKPADI